MTTDKHCVLFGLAGLFLMTIVFLAGSLPANPNAPPGLSAAMVRYFRSGQLAADARTACSLAQFLLDLEPSVVTNLSAAGPAPNPRLPTH